MAPLVASMLLLVLTSVATTHGRTVYPHGFSVSRSSHGRPNRNGGPGHSRGFFNWHSRRYAGSSRDVPGSDQLTKNRMKWMVKDGRESDAADVTDGGDAADGTDGDAAHGTDAGDAADGTDGGDTADGTDGGDAADGTDGGDAAHGTDGGDAADGTDGDDAADGTDGGDTADGTDGGDAAHGGDAADGTDGGDAADGTDGGDAAHGTDGGDAADGTDGDDAADGTDTGDAAHGTDGGDAADGTDGGDAVEGPGNDADGNEGIVEYMKRMFDRRKEGHSEPKDVSILETFFKDIFGGRNDADEDLQRLRARRDAFLKRYHNRHSARRTAGKKDAKAFR